MVSLCSFGLSTKFEEEKVPGLEPIEPNTSVKLTCKCSSGCIELPDLCRIPVVNKSLCCCKALLVINIHLVAVCKLSIQRC